MKWINPDTVLAVHDRQLAEHGGAGGVRDMNLLLSALDRPRQRLALQGADVFDLAAEYAFGIVRNHPFTDGNKRTAYVVARLFLRLNGRDMARPGTERVAMFVALAQGRVDVSSFAAWLRG